MPCHDCGFALFSLEMGRGLCAKCSYHGYRRFMRMWIGDVFYMFGWRT